MPMPLGTRAVSIVIAPGQESDECPLCGERVKYKARWKQRKLICNVYVDGRGEDLPHGALGGRWERVEEWHEFCYVEAGSPYGPPIVRRAPQTPGKRADLDDPGLVA